MSPFGDECSTRGETVRAFARMPTHAMRLHEWGTRGIGAMSRVGHLPYSGLLIAIKRLESITGAVTDMNYVHLRVRDVDRVDDAVDVRFVAVEEMAQGTVFGDDGITLGMVSETFEGFDKSSEPLVSWRRALGLNVKKDCL
ncbi:hypothetical protein RBB78_20125 [Tunturiibacter empetritectus]